MIENSLLNSPRAEYLADSFSDIDEFSETTRDWDLDLRQLDPGVLSAKLGVVIQGHPNLMHFQFSRSFHQAGSAITGLRNFAILEQGVTGVSWCGREVDESTLICFHPGGSLKPHQEQDFKVSAFIQRAAIS